MRALPLILWLALILSAFWVAETGRKNAHSPAMIAGGILPQNTLLLPGPFTPNAFAMRYVRPDAGFTAGGTIGPADLSPLPVLPVVPGDHVLATVQVAWPLVQSGLNAGRGGQICRDALALGAVTVMAVRCDNAAPSRSCNAVVSVPLAAESLLRALVKPDGLRLAPSC